MSLRLLVATLLLALVAAAPTAELQAQADGPGWLPVQAGLRLGYDNSVNGTVAGAQLRIPVVPSGRFELVPSGDVTFLTGLEEYQFNLDGVFVTGGRGGGVYLGGGVAFRNSIFGEEVERETRTGANAVVGLVTRGSVGAVPIGVQLEARWIFVDAPFDPRTFTFGVNLPLWGWGRGGGGFR